MKYVLTPLTTFLWYLTAYYGLYFAVFGMAYMYTVSWFWLIMSGIFLMWPLWLMFGLPFLMYLLLCRPLIEKIYGINWFSCIIHSLAGITGIVQVVRFFSANPPQLVIGDKSIFILAGMWEIAPFRTIFVACPFVVFTQFLLWLTIVHPIYIKFAGEEL